MSREKTDKMPYRILAKKQNGWRDDLLDGAPAQSSTISLFRNSLRLSVTELATCHFLSNFVLLPRCHGGRGYLEFVLPLLVLNASSPSKLPHFKYAFEACAMACFHFRVQRGRNCGLVARGHYIKAISATATALQDPELSNQDSTLAAILLLGYFENFVGEKAGIAAWGSHIDGAIQLVKARGRAQMQTPIGRDLFLTVRAQMVCHR